MISFTVYGEPQGKGRPRASMRGGYAKIYTPDKTISYEQEIKQAFIIAAKGCKPPIQGPASVFIHAYFGFAKSDFNSKGELNKAGRRKAAQGCTKKPDLDNIAKIVCDALNGLAYVDDSQIVWMNVRKDYDATPRVEVLIAEKGEE